MTRSLFRFLARFLIASLLFAQLAVAAYACPRDGIDSLGTAMAEMADMQDCAQMSQHEKAVPSPRSS
jgi:hypothetical protein